MQLTTKIKKYFGSIIGRYLGVAELRCNVSLALFDRLELDAGEYPLKFGWIDDNMLSIR